MSRIIPYELFESGEPLEFKTFKDDDEDRTTIEGYDGGKFVGQVIFEHMVAAYWYFEDDFTEDEYDEMFPDDELLRVEHLKVQPEYMRKGYGDQLMKECVRMMKETGVKKAYLNASPMGSEGAQLSQLIKIYEKYGFKVLMHQGHNAQMIMDIK